MASGFAGQTSAGRWRAGTRTRGRIASRATSKEASAPSRIETVGVRDRVDPLSCRSFVNPHLAGSAVPSRARPAAAPPAPAHHPFAVARQAQPSPKETRPQALVRMAVLGLIYCWEIDYGIRGFLVSSLGLYRALMGAGYPPECCEDTVGVS